MIYDYAIIGAGISGPICAYRLAKMGKKCIIFEKNNTSSEKVCGGGISYKAIRSLESIGIKTEPLFFNNSKIIRGHIINRLNNKPVIKIYSCPKRSLGIQRKIFDSYLLECALKEGASILYGHNIKTVIPHKKEYIINNILARNIIWAIGAKGLHNVLLDGQSIGYSGQIVADSCLDSSFFYYWYYDSERSDKYFWSFPIGNNLWNVGLWSKVPFENIKDEYNNCIKKYFINSLKSEWEYFRRPRADFLGHVDQRQHINCMKLGVGDFAGKCNSLNGGGIIGAIDSAIELTQSILEECQ